MPTATVSPKSRLPATARTCGITAPAAFNFERLFYLGSEKGEDDIGHYGEGFKVAATCLLRNHAVTILVASGHSVLHLRIADESVQEIDLFPVEYDFYKSEKEIGGTVLLLGNCAPKVTKAMAQGLSHLSPRRQSAPWCQPLGKRQQGLQHL